MPITPFHFGPGLAAKALAARSFSWTAFAAAQVVIDCETLYYIVTHQYPLHRGMHTFLGATTAGIVTGGILALVVRNVPQIGRLVDGMGPSLRSEIDIRSLIIGGIIGGASHPLLDGMMHSDIRPFAPWTETNPLLGIIGLGALHFGCMIAALIGVVVLWIRVQREGPANQALDRPAAR